MDKHFTLTSRKNVFTAAGNRVTVIGQSEGCDIKIPNKTGYEDVIFAKIIPDKSGFGWHLVRSTEFYPILVNGQILNRVHYLHEGDNLDFDGTSFRFNIREGENSRINVTHIHGNRNLTWMLMAAIVLIGCVVAFLIWDSRKDSLSNRMVADIESSIFMTRVDSLYLMKGDSVLSSYVYESGPVGTAFLTTDSLLVTARHCVQPWLNKILPQDYSTISRSDDWSIAKALFAETENQLSGFEEYRIVSFLTLTDTRGKEFVINSDPFRFNYDFDEIVEVGDFNSSLYWRSISHRYSRRDMMLGDVAVARFDKGGTIVAADYDCLVSEAVKNTKLYFFGFPESGVNGNHLEVKDDVLRLQIDTITVPGHIFMLAHEGGLSPGFSGGPVIMRSGTGFKAVGVISVIDDKNVNFSYSVPVSEIKRLK